MSRYALSILFSLYTCIGWGMVAPLLVKMKQSGVSFGPLYPFMWDTLGRVVIITATLLITGFEPLRSWQWHWTGGAVAFLWPTAGLAVIYAIQLASGKESVPNTIAVSYFAFVSAPILWYFFGEAMTGQKILGILITLVGVVLVATS